MENSISAGAIQKIFAQGKTRQGSTVFQGKVLKLKLVDVELPAGKVVQQELVQHAEVASVVPLTRDDQLLMIRQYRNAVGSLLLEMPAGRIEPGENPAEAARRELREETGYEAEQLTRLLSFFPAPGFCDMLVHVFLATELTFLGQNLDDTEFVEVVKIPFAQAVQRVWSGEIRDTTSAAGILAAESLIKNNFKLIK
ncbi:MAG: NUDIX hydrolase [Peptococcaceae bacterium]|jgi:ADP-ribose pyrophosphatase|nr:NUDIX hydrolase [Peptococcaceae bacterium]